MVSLSNWNLCLSVQTHKTRLYSTQETAWHGDGVSLCEWTDCGREGDEDTWLGSEKKKKHRTVTKAVLSSCFRDMHKELCYGKAGLCDAMKPIKGTELLKFLRRVTFEGLSGDMFKFDPNGDGPARYNIIHFKQISLGKYQWIKVGEYMEGELRLNMNGKMWAGEHGSCAVS